MRQAETRSEWLSWRRRGLGGSDIGAVAGMSGYKTPFDVYCEKLGVSSRVGTAARRGSVLEDMVVQMLVEDTGRRFVEPPHFTHPDHDWWRCSPDRYDLDDETLGLEVKTAAGGWKDVWGAPGTDEVRPDAWAQVQWYMGGDPSRTAYEVPLFWVDRNDYEGDDYDLYRVPRNERGIAALAVIGETFWTEHVLEQVPPLPDEGDAVAWTKVSHALGRLYDDEVAEMIEATPDIREAAARYADARAEEKAWKEAKEAAGAQLKAAFGTSQGAIWDGGKATWKKTKGRARVAHDRVAMRLLDELDSALQSLDDVDAERIRQRFNHRAVYRRLITECTTTQASRRIDVRIKESKS